MSLIIMSIIVSGYAISRPVVKTARALGIPA